MTPERLKEIAERRKASTPGWHLRDEHSGVVRVHDGAILMPCDMATPMDIVFAADAQRAVDDLTDHVASLTTRLAAETEARERAEQERDACHRAKDENDDRFMRERDEAREAAAEYQRRLAAVMVAFGSPERGTDLAAEIIGMRTELATVREWLGMATRFESKDRGVFIDLECGMWGLYLSTGDVITYSKYPSIDATFAALKSP